MRSCDALRTIAVRGERYSVSCGSRYCPACGEVWAKDQRIRAVAAAKSLTGDGALITLTGPGNDVLIGDGPANQQRIRSRKAWWNFTARERYATLFRLASSAARKWAREHGCDWRVLYRTWEWQRRRILHVHIVLPFGTPQERYATTMFVRALWERSRDHGFGFVLGGERGDRPSWDRPPPIARVGVNAIAAYVSKYVSKAGSTRNGMVNVARAAGMRGSVLYVAPRLLRESGVSMTTLRSRRAVVSRFPWALSSRRSWAAACVVHGFQRGHAPLTQQAVDALRREAEGGEGTYLLGGAEERAVEPTRAPEPLGLSGYAPRPVRPGRVVCVALAPVLLRVSEPENLGWWRTDVAAIEAIRGGAATETYANA